MNGTSRSDVTILIYCFDTPERLQYRIGLAQSVLKRTRSCVGCLPAVIVANGPADICIPNVELQIEPSLVPGDIDSMSYDCITRLWKRFDTEYVLIVQEDGYPVRAGLDRFVGRFDFIGPTMVRRSRRRLASLLGVYPMCGGFSLRSRRICRRAAAAYGMLKWFAKPGTRWFPEDGFYTMTAMLLPWYRFGLRWPTWDAVDEFAWDGMNGLNPQPDDLPFGVHGKTPLAPGLIERR